MPDTTSIRPLHIRWLKLSHTVHFCAHQAGCDVWIPTCQAADVNPAEVQFGGKTRTKGGALITTSPFYMHMILDALKEGFVTTRSIGSLLISFLITHYHTPSECSGRCAPTTHHEFGWQNFVIHCRTMPTHVNIVRYLICRLRQLVAEIIPRPRVAT